MEEEINYRYLRKIQQSEKNSPKISELSSDFYKQLTDYIKTLEDNSKRENTEQKQKIINEEIKNTKKIIENIYEHREKKIILAAITKARGGKPNIENLIDYEQELFDSIYSILQKSREELYKKNNDLKQKKTKNLKNHNENQIINNENKNPIILLTEDIPEFVGTDTKKYLLKKNDIISISPHICELLSKRDKCKELSN